MSMERRYTEQEIASIFKQASEAQEAALQRTGGDGLTLAEIEAIGREAGIKPEFIARAAASVDRKVSTPAPDTALGLPVSVGKTVDLAGDFSDEDWQQLVTDLHDVMEVTGRVSENGRMRIWEYDHMEVVVEPVAKGHRIRMRSRHELFSAGLYGGLMFFAMGLFFLLIVASKGDLMTYKSIVSMFSVVGAGAMGGSAFKLAGWRKEQEARMDTLLSRLKNANKHTFSDKKEAGKSTQEQEPAMGKPVSVPDEILQERNALDGNDVPNLKNRALQSRTRT